MAKHSSKSRMTEIGEESRQRILDAAEKLFLEKGYDGTTLADIGRLSGISYGSIPWHFQNKQGLLVAVAERHWDAAELDEIQPGVQGLDGIIRQMEFSDNSPISTLVTNIFYIMNDRDSEAYKRVIARNEKRHQDLIQWVEATMDGREILGGHTPESLVTFWLSSSRGIFLMGQYLGNPMHPDNSPRAVLRQSIMALMGLKD